MADVICPQCRKPNPETRGDCQHCGARLRAGTEPLPPIRPGEKPVKKNTSELERALPEWLRSARKASDGSEPQHATSLDGKDVRAPRPKEEMPNWLAGLEAQSGSKEEEVPDWLRGLQGEPAAPAAPAAEDSPDWLREITGAAPTPTTPRSEPTRPAAQPSTRGTPPPTPPAARVEPLKPAEEPPARSAPTEPVRAVRMAAAPPSPAPSPAEALPDWLRGAAPAASAPDQGIPASTPVRTSPAAHERLPDWLAEKVSAASSDEHKIPLPGPSGSDDSAADLPDWLSRLSAPPAESDMRPGQLGRASEIEPAPEPPAPAAAGPAVPPIPEPAEMPDWLKSLTAESPGGPPPLSGTPALIMDEPIEGVQDVNEIFSMEMPDWLSGMSAGEKPRPAATEPFITPPPPSDALAPADLPSWVQAMRPVESALAEDGSAVVDEEDVQEQEQRGPLAGLRGVLPAGVGFSPGRKPQQYPNKLQVSDSQHSHAALLEHLLEMESQPRPITAQDQARSQRMLRWGIALVMLLVTLLPLLSGRAFTPILARGLYPPEMSDTLTVINSLPSGAPALLVFDYDPALSGEVEAAAGALVDHLMLRGARLTLLSTSPTGPALAERFIRSQTQTYVAGEQYLNLGYLAGGPAGILAFSFDPAGVATRTVDGADAWTLPPLQGVNALSDFALVVVLTDSADTGRLWIEQSGPYRGGRPLLLAVSAQAEPMLRPYYDSRQVQGMLTGLAGGAAYEQINGRPGLARRYWDSFGLGLILAAALIAGGSLVNLLVGRGNRRGEEA